MKRTFLAVPLFVVATLGACSKSSVPRTTASAPIAGPTPTVTRAEPQGSVSSPNAIPQRLADAEYWKLLSDISEPGGYFRIEDNYTSNEMEVGQLFTMLRTSGVNGDVYMGVGPEQNFTYIAAVRPKMAFIVDIRRQAVMQHLMFKAMFEMSKDRGEFISLLFGKPRPAGIDSATPIQKTWEAYRNVPSDSALAAQNYTKVVDRLTQQHGFTFTADETAQLRSVFNAFYYYGPSITTRGGMGGGRGGNSGDFSDLTGYSPDASGQPRSFLSSEDNYRYVKGLQDRNLIIPVSGDFAGPKAIRAIGKYLNEHNARVRAFYVSNVEQYLFQDGHDRAFYANVAALPVDSGSVFIRPYSMRRSSWGGPTQSLCPIGIFLKAAEAGRVPDNNYALSCGP
ncbi:MAG: hypothetical protein ACREBE_26040 [bacterium]